jgi:hypothetical protein
MANATTLAASPTKLRSGSWGARVNGPAAVGDIVTITTRGGKTWDAEVTKVVWTGEGVSVCATAATAPVAVASSARITVEEMQRIAPARRSGPPPCDSCDAPRAHRATDMSGLSGYACYRCDDGFLSFG